MNNLEEMLDAPAKSSGAFHHHNINDEFFEEIDQAQMDYLSIQRQMSMSKSMLKSYNSQSSDDTSDKTNE